MAGALALTIYSPVLYLKRYGRQSFVAVMAG
jgi:hypothetical protein